MNIEIFWAVLAANLLFFAAAFVTNIALDAYATKKRKKKLDEMLGELKSLKIDLDKPIDDAPLPTKKATPSAARTRKPKPKA